MATKRGKKSTKKIKNLAAKSLSADKAKRVRGGINFGKLDAQSLPPKTSRKSFT
jgi:hypothetical protein